LGTASWEVWGGWRLGGVVGVIVRRNCRSKKDELKKDVRRRTISRLERKIGARACVNVYLTDSALLASGDGGHGHRFGYWRLLDGMDIDVVVLEVRGFGFLDEA
jgi:hypothetical protein